MIRFIKEVMYFLGQLKHKYPRQRDAEAFKRFAIPALSMELGAHSHGECLVAASRVVPHQFVGELAALLYCRCNRGDMSVDRAVGRLQMMFPGGNK